MESNRGSCVGGKLTVSIHENFPLIMDISFKITLGGLDYELYIRVDMDDGRMRWEIRKVRWLVGNEYTKVPYKGYCKYLGEKYTMLIDARVHEEMNRPPWE